MTNHLIRDQFKAKVDQAVVEARNAVEVLHPGLQGKIKEIVVAKLLQPLIPTYIQIGSGKLTDWIGNLSSEIDVILYSHDILPPLKYDEKLGIFPIESVLLTIEVKSISTATFVKETVDKIRRDTSKLKHLIIDAPDKSIKCRQTYVAPASVYFAFDSDLSGTGKSELERYRECDTEANHNPAIGSICVVGQGYWWFNGETKKWHKNITQEDNEEIIDFVGSILNTIPTLMSRKVKPAYGPYIIKTNKIVEQ